MPKPEELNPSYSLVHGVQSMNTAALEELRDYLTPDNLPGFLDLVESELSRREEESAE